jgi:nucleotide-binding universal stress UspA family protein
MARSGLLVVGLDTSPKAPMVLAQAIDLATDLRARLVAVRAVGLPPELPVEALGIAPDELPATLLGLAKRALDDLLRGVPEGLVASVETALGPAWHVICRVATERHADLVVIGAHGHAVLLDRVLGTTASRVVAHAPCSVLVCREPLSPA